MPTLRTCLAGLLAAAALAAPARAGDLRYFEDAALHAVQFVDANEGWAVGDEGVIWHSIDGGAHWERQPSGVRGSLRSLHFLNPYTGWVAGREELPGGRSAGVLLYTDDGGLHWQRVLLGALPGLNVVRFVDEKTGYAAGDGADLYPSGVFATADSGRTWQPVPGPRATSWLAADFGPDGGALAGAWNRLATLRHGRTNAIEQDTLAGRSLRGLRLHGDGGVAVGQGGLVLVSRGSRGATWGFAELKLPPGTEAAWDFHAVGGAGAHLWVVGRPGSAALHSPDGGKTWQVVRTGQPLPLNGVFFRDEQHGWAVGELGSVLATGDGGKTWQVQRRGGQRAAVLCVHARAAGAPLDTVALLGGQEGYLTAGVRVTAPDSNSASPARAAEGPRFSAAVRQAGGAAGEMLWQFPVPSHLTQAGRDELVEAWDALHNRRAAEHLLGQLVLALRVWRPDVVLTDHPDVGVTGSAADALLAEAVREAFRRAGDPEAFPEHLKVLGLEAWKPTKLYARWEGHNDAQVTLDLTAVCDRLGSTPREFAAAPAELLGAPALPAERNYRFLADRADGASAGDHDLMQGVILAPGGLARRALPPVEAPGAEVVKAVRQRAALRALADAACRPGAPAAPMSSPERVLAQIGPMLQDMPDDQAAPAAFGVARQYARLGQWGMAREAFLLVTERYPTHPLTAEAYRWLIRHNSSSEARRRHDLGQFLVVGRLEVGLPRAGEAAQPVNQAGHWRPAEHGEGNPDVPLPQGFEEPGKPAAKPKLPTVPAFEARATQQVALLNGKPEARQWYQSSLDLGPRLAALGPLFANDPSVQFCLQAARRNLGEYEAPLAWYRQFAARQPDGPWRSAALAELWLANRTGPPPRPALTCRFTETRPFLDGKLDDPCWKGAVPVRLQNAAGDTLRDCPTEVRLAYDRDFLYLAVRCAHPAGKQVAAAKPRLHDVDLRGHDRVSLLLDLDRDYSTCFHLQIDQRGCVCDDCWGDKTWGPRWFVAVQDEPAGWTAEAAIPLTALTGDTVTSGRAWAVNVVRVLPGRGVQAFSLPAEAPEEALRPEGLGLLLFTQSPTGPVAERGAMPRAE
jgi:photosystem II stability/assembly factor-like uncharacterized protein